MSTQPITTAVFPVAGLGTRFLPITKAGPKEMLPIVDKPLIQYVVEEAVAAGIKQLVFVTSSSKRAIEDYFDSNYELESMLESRGKLAALSKVKNIIPSDVSIVYVRQSHPRGLGHAVLCAKNVVGNQPFAVLLADDIIDNPNKLCLQQMVDVYNSSGASVLAVEQVPQNDTDKYGIVSLGKKNNIKAIVEKPKPADAPSRLAVTGRYILTPAIFSLLEQTQSGVGGEIQLTDAIATLLTQEPVIAHPFAGIRYDCGSPTGFLDATLNYALKDPELKTHIVELMQDLLKKV